MVPRSVTWKQLCWRTSSALCSLRGDRPEARPLKAEFAGKINLYVDPFDALIAHEEDRATVGFILCAGRDEAVAHLTLQGIATPLAVTRYTVGEHGLKMVGEDAQITEGLEQEMESLRRVEQQVTEYTDRRARDLVDSVEQGNSEQAP